MTVPFLLAKSAISLLKYVAKAMPIKKRRQGPFHPMDSVTYLAYFAQKALGTIFFAPSFQALFISCSKVFLLQDFFGANFSIYPVFHPHFPLPGTFSYDTGNFAA